MASSSRQDNAPQPCDARGLLIPDDIVKFKDYLKADSATFFGSYQFYVKASKNAYENPQTDRSILRYLSAIPDHHFRLIRSLCLDFGLNIPVLGGDLNGGDWHKCFKRIIGDILLRGGKDLVIKIQWCDHGTTDLACLDDYQFERQHYEDLCGNRPNFLWRPLKDFFRNSGYDADRIKPIRIKKWESKPTLGGRFKTKDQSTGEAFEKVLEEMSDDTWDEESCGTIEEDGIAWNYRHDSLKNEYENIFKIDPISKNFVSDAWKPVLRDDGRRLDEWLADELKDNDLDHNIYAEVRKFVATPTPCPKAIFSLLAL